MHKYFHSHATLTVCTFQTFKIHTFTPTMQNNPNIHVICVKQIEMTIKAFNNIVNKYNSRSKNHLSLSPPVVYLPANYINVISPNFDRCEPI